MNRKLLMAVAATLALAACGSSESTTEVAPKAEPKAQKTLKEVDPEAYHSNIESAFAEVPPEQFQQFQKLFLCEMKRNNALPQPKPVNAEYVRILWAHLKANPSAGDTCTA
jgi:nitrous oxide reductase accessory protein NosL